MLGSEKKSLYRFLAIYLLSTFALFSLAAWIFFISSKQHLLEQQSAVLKYEAQQIKSAIRMLHKSNKAELLYPQSDIVKSAMYDLDGSYIFGTFQTPPSLERHHDKSKLYLEVKVEPYYLGAAHLLLAKDIDKEPIQNLKKKIILFMLGAGVFFALLGYFLGKLFVAPMRDSLEQLNHFIQDTTHELNTPISTILTNVEMIEALGKHHDNNAELKRIEIASKTLSRIYDDLTYLNLNHDYHREVVSVDLEALVAERLVYFDGMIKTKNLQLVCYCEEKVLLQMDKNDAIRLVDNLISNAIKYNKKEGLLEISLTNEYLSVKDTGVGIKTSEIALIQKRFKRANKSEGGFGIGLDIVNQVVKNYSFELEISSQVHAGTEVIIRWKK